MSHVVASHGGLALRTEADVQLDLRFVQDAARVARTAAALVSVRLMEMLEKAADAWRGDFAEAPAGFGATSS